MLAEPVPFVNVSPGDVALTVIPTPGVDCAAVPDPFNPRVWPVPVSTVVKTDAATEVLLLSALEPDTLTTLAVISPFTSPSIE